MTKINCVFFLLTVHKKPLREVEIAAICQDALQVHASFELIHKKNFTESFCVSCSSDTFVVRLNVIICFLLFTGTKIFTPKRTNS